jgi:hypothetical protein
MRDEGEFLRLQAAEALARCRRTVRAMGDDLIAPLRLRPLVQKRPLWSLGGAVLTGFVVGLGLRRRGKAAAPASAGGKVHELLAAARLRVGRVLRAAAAAAFVSNLRGPARQPDAAAAGASAMQPTPAADEVASP